MTRLITVVSAKGGVGKTTLTSNLGTCLADMGKDVVVLDANLTTPNLGIHLGMPLAPVTLHDVLKGKAHIHDAIYYQESGLKIIPAGLSLKDLRGTDARDLPNALLDLLGNVDMVLIDGAAGLGKEALAAIESGDELVLVTNPELPAVTDALKAIKLAEQVGTKVRGVVINRVSGKKHQMSKHDIMDMLETPILAEIPEERAIQESIAHRTPVVHHRPDSRASRQFRDLASLIIGEEPEKRSWLRKLLG